MDLSIPSSTFVWRFRLLVCAAVLGVSATAVYAQAAGSDYTKDLPSVQRIETELKGTDATDTAARQVAMFEYLQVYIRRIKETRDYRGPYSPGEQKLMADYAKAQYDLTENFKKSNSAQEVARFNGLEGQYSVNNALGWIKQMEGQQAADTYRGTESSLAQTYKQHEDQMQKQAKSDGGGGLANDPVLDPLGIFAKAEAKTDSDPETHRCLELGGTVDQCESLGPGSAIGLVAALVSLGGSDEKAPPPLSGVVLVGEYHSRTELPEVGLTPDGSAILKKCGTLVDGTRPYTLRKSSAATQIVLDNEPNPIVLNLRPDGSLSGPGNIAVKGAIITAYHNVTTCTQGSINANCSTTSTPIYSPSMQRCTVGEMAPQPPPPPPPKPTGIAALAADMFGAPVAPIYGFRMVGPYAGSNGMKLAFDNQFVTVDCGQAHVNAPYTVENSASGFVVHVQNGGGAFLLGVAGDTTLRGSGSTTVAGKLVSSLHGENVSFTPHSESCSVGTFAPKGTKNTMVASNAPAPTVASYSNGGGAAEPASSVSVPSAPAGSTSLASTLAGAGISSAAPGTRAQFRVMLSSNFSGANPLAGQAVFVARKPMDQILRELGVAVPAKATPGQAMKALQTQCHSAQGCSSVIQGMPKYYVTTTKLDGSGKATLSATAATGSYYFFAIVPDSGGSLVWDVPAQLAAGDNAVAFNQGNAERVE